MGRTRREKATPSPNFRTIPAGGRLTLEGLSVQQARIMTVLPRNRVSNLRLSIHGGELVSLVILTSRFGTTRGLFWDGLVILDRSQMTRTTPELAPPSPYIIRCELCKEWWHEECSSYEGSGAFVCDYC
ncbi:hypothetical protein AVEN_251427-1 [Araneus ventricosus]|uniref:Zinc finger PHD-type domain-containing protein n=1 Tax=Araneus ventricosus TaxID=182803 RepID=A0A4Y2LAN8_ARAVE|nr:hypothetical protein AVEN_251427-1 [Araneus ventricosus]